MEKKTGKKEVSIRFQDETKIHPALKSIFGYCLKKAAIYMTSLHAEALKKHHILPHHLGMLRVIESSRPISQIDIGTQLGIDKASMVKLIDQLEKKGLVTRKGSSQDRRIKNIELTVKGEKLLKICAPLRESAEKEFFKNLTVQEQKTLRELIIRVLPEPGER